MFFNPQLRATLSPARTPGPPARARRAGRQQALLSAARPTPRYEDDIPYPCPPQTPIRCADGSCVSWAPLCPDAGYLNNPPQSIAAPSPELIPVSIWCYSDVEHGSWVCMISAGDNHCGCRIGKDAGCCCNIGPIEVCADGLLPPPIQNAMEGMKPGQSKTIYVDGVQAAAAMRRAAAQADLIPVVGSCDFELPSGYIRCDISAPGINCFKIGSEPWKCCTSAPLPPACSGAAVPDLLDAIVAKLRPGEQKTIWVSRSAFMGRDLGSAPRGRRARVPGGVRATCKTSAENVTCPHGTVFEHKVWGYCCGAKRLSTSSPTARRLLFSARS